MYCAKCGKAIGDEDVFCRWCGAKVEWRREGENSFVREESPATHLALPLPPNPPERGVEEGEEFEKGGEFPLTPTDLRRRYPPAHPHLPSPSRTSSGEGEVKVGEEQERGEEIEVQPTEVYEEEKRSSIHIYRGGVLYFLMGKMKINLDNRDAGQLGYLKSISIPVFEGEHQLQVTMGRLKSNAITFNVKGDESISFRCGVHFWWAYFFPFTYFSPGSAFYLSRFETNEDPKTWMEKTRYRLILLGIFIFLWLSCGVFTLWMDHSASGEVVRSATATTRRVSVTPAATVTRRVTDTSVFVATNTRRAFNEATATPEDLVICDGGKCNQCMHWTEVDNWDIGDEVCVYGVAYDAFPAGNDAYAITFQRTGGLRLLNYDGIWYEDVVGDCIAVIGEVKNTHDGLVVVYNLYDAYDTNFCD